MSSAASQSQAEDPNSVLDFTQSVAGQNYSTAQITALQNGDYTQSANGTFTGTGSSTGLDMTDIASQYATWKAAQSSANIAGNSYAALAASQPGRALTTLTGAAATLSNTIVGTPLPTSGISQAGNGSSSSGPQRRPGNPYNAPTSVPLSVGTLGTPYINNIGSTPPRTQVK